MALGDVISGGTKLQAVTTGPFMLKPLLIRSHRPDSQVWGGLNKSKWVTTVDIILPSAESSTRETGNKPGFT